MIPMRFATDTDHQVRTKERCPNTCVFTEVMQTKASQSWLAACCALRCACFQAFSNLRESRILSSSFLGRSGDGLSKVVRPSRPTTFYMLLIGSALAIIHVRRNIPRSCASPLSPLSTQQFVCLGAYHGEGGY